MLAEIRVVLRSLVRAKGTAGVALVLLAVTVGAAVTTFAVVDAVSLKPLPYANPGRLVSVAHVSKADGILEGAAPQEYFQWHDMATSFDGLAMAARSQVVEVRADGVSQEVVSARISVNLFEVLGVSPSLGRPFGPQDATPGQDAVALLTHDVWVRSFGAEPGIVGRRISIVRGKNERVLEVVGVLPRGIGYPMTSARPVDVFVPYVPIAADRDPASRARAYALDVVARLRSGVDLAAASADLARVNLWVRSEYPDNDMAGSGYVVLPLKDRIVGPGNRWLLLSFAAVLCVLLIGCVNAASLLLSRATVRTREFATRCALGASQARVATTLLAEGMIIALAATSIGLLFAVWGVEFARSRLPEDLARSSSIAVNGRVLVGAGVAALACGLIAGAVPAWSVWRSNLFGRARLGATIVGDSAHGRWLGRFLVAQLSAVTVLLVATFLSMVSLSRIVNYDMGFDRRNVVAFHVSTSIPVTTDVQRVAAASSFFSEIADRVNGISGVRSVGFIAGGAPPLSGGSTKYPVRLSSANQADVSIMFETRAVSAEYFSAMGLRLLNGRVFSSTDKVGAPRVAIINEKAARRLFPGRDATGEVLELRGAAHRVVGVIKDVRIYGPERDAEFEIYIPLAQDILNVDPVQAHVVVRTAEGAVIAAQDLRGAILSVRSRPRVQQAFVVDDAFRRLVAHRTFNAQLMMTFGALAIVLATVGIYATTGFVVAQQTRVIGLRRALGEARHAIVRRIVLASLGRVALGVALGLVAARAVERIFSSLVFGVSTTSLVVYTVVAVASCCLGVLASLLPALRAGRLDPIIALRSDG